MNNLEGPYDKGGALYICKGESMKEQQALQIVRTRCSKSGTCRKCPYMRDDICEVRKTLTRRTEKQKPIKRLKK